MSRGCASGRVQRRHPRDLRAHPHRPRALDDHTARMTSGAPASKPSARPASGGFTPTRTCAPSASPIRWSAAVPRYGMSKRGYHHGNLRQALVEAALGLIESRGPRRLHPIGGRQAGRRHHRPPSIAIFAGREDLIARPRVRLCHSSPTVMRYAYEKGQPSARGQLRGDRARPTLPSHGNIRATIIAMFESGISVNRTPELAHEASRARAVIERAAERTEPAHPALETAPRSDVQTPHIWACRMASWSFSLAIRPAPPRPSRPKTSMEQRHRHLPARSWPHRP